MPAVGFVLVGDDSGDARAEHELDLCERPDESGAQCRIGVVDGTDLIERDPRSEVVAAAMGRFLKVLRVAGEPVAVGNSEEGGTRCLSPTTGPRLMLQTLTEPETRPFRTGA